MVPPHQKSMFDFWKSSSKEEDAAEFLGETALTPTSTNQSSPVLSTPECSMQPMTSENLSTPSTTSSQKFETFDSISVSSGENFSTCDDRSEKSDRIEEIDDIEPKNKKSEAEGISETQSRAEEEINFQSPDEDENEDSSNTNSENSSNESKNEEGKEPSSPKPDKSPKNKKKKSKGSSSPRKKVFNFIQRFSDSINKKLNSYLDKLHYFKGITTFLEKSQIACYTTSTQFSASIQKRAAKLQKKIDKVLEIHKQRFKIPPENAHQIKCILICHSMGGLDARYLCTKV